MSHYFYGLIHLEVRAQVQNIFLNFLVYMKTLLSRFTDLTQPRIFRPSYGPGQKIAYILKKGRKSAQLKV